MWYLNPKVLEKEAHPAIKTWWIGRVSWEGRMNHTGDCEGKENVLCHTAMSGWHSTHVKTQRIVQNQCQILLTGDTEDCGLHKFWGTWYLLLNILILLVLF